MSALALPEPPPLVDAWRLLHRVDWSDASFAREKAYVCALFSEAAYWQIPEFELSPGSRFKVVPCHAYRLLVGGRIPPSEIDEHLLRHADMDRPVVIARRFAVTVIFRLQKVVFVAIRGTKYLYDWAVNLNAGRVRLPGTSNGSLFHRGFFRAAAASFSALGEALRGHLSDGTPVYVTGHSLGGALAAIMHSIWGLTVGMELAQDGVVGHRRSTHSAYTFGMPRFGDEAAIATFRNPYHVYNERDIVPSVPPRWLGFDDCLSEYRMDGKCLERAPQRDVMALTRWLIYLISGVGIRAHFMEGYRRGLAP